MGKFIYIASRLGRFLLTILFISSLVFLLIRILPGDPASTIAGIDAAPEDVERIRESLNLNGSPVAQYGRFLADTFRLDFGDSYMTGQPVRRMIASRLPVTLALAALGMLISLLIAIPLGILSAVKRMSFWDALGMTVSQLGMALPEFWLAIIVLLVFSVRLGWFPLFGFNGFRSLVLPAFSLGLARAAVLLRLTRASMVEQLGREYVITARAKGLPTTHIHYRHVLKNALLPVVTIAGLQFGYLLGGAIIIEQIFSLPGLGRLFLTGIYQRDFPVIQGGVIFMVVVFSLVNFLTDLLYTVINPKIRTSETG